MKKPSTRTSSTGTSEHDARAFAFMLPDESISPRLLEAARRLQKALDERAEAPPAPDLEEPEV